ncbi:MAG TPA: polysaccharide biosynthesis tyrosine autokinase [Polyangia bacterium]
MSSILGLLRKRKWLILGLTACAGIATGFVVSKQPPVYEATASIVIELSVPQYLGSGFRDVVEVEPSWWSSRETLETEFRTLRSLSQATHVAKALCDREYNGAPALKVLLPDTKCLEQDDYARAAPMLQGMIRISPAKESRIVEMTARSTDPAFAALLANTAVQVYTDRNLERRLAHSAGAATWLGEEYNQLMAELRAAENKLIAFKSQNKIVSNSIEDDENEVSTRRRSLAAELGSVEVRLIALRNERDALASTGKADPVTELNTAVGKSTVAQKLKELYIEEYGKLIALQGKYLEKHPSVVAQEERLKSIKEDLAREVEIARKSLDTTFAALTKQAQDLRAALDSATREAIKIDAKNAEYSSLKRDLDRLVRLSEQVGGRGRETSLASNLKTNNVRLLDKAQVPKSPVAPNVPRAISIALAAALLLSVGLAMLLEALDNTVKTQEDVESFVGMTFLGIVPRMEVDERSGRAPPLRDENDNELRDLYVFQNPKSQAAECCRAIRTNLLFMSPDRPARTMLITSAGPQEGKTTVAVSMAITMAQSGLRVLIVDTDMRRPRIHRALGIPATTEGLSSAILGKAGVLTYVRASVVPNLWILPCGACPPNPSELIHADRFHQIIKEVANEFDRVIFDSPPLGAVTDASILARMTDATMMVAKAGRTSKYALLRARRLFTADSRINLLGCVLNDISLSNQKEYGYYPYYYSRYGYYGPSEEPMAQTAGKA